VAPFVLAADLHLNACNPDQFHRVRHWALRKRASIARRAIRGAPSRVLIIAMECAAVECCQFPDGAASAAPATKAASVMAEAGFGGRAVVALRSASIKLSCELDHPWRTVEVAHKMKIHGINH
jgi:hypothetical protein